MQRRGCTQIERGMSMPTQEKAQEKIQIKNRGKTQVSQPLYIRMRDEDNVAIVANQGGLYPGAVFADGLQLIEQIPQGHKVALQDIAADGVIRRYGEVIGYAA